MDMTIMWWVLVTLGVVLLIAELFVGAFIVMWFGIGSILAGLLTALLPGLNLGIQVLTAVSVGAAMMYFLRHRLVAKANGLDEELYTFSSTQGSVRIDEKDGSLTVFANGTFWQVANPEAIPDELRNNGAQVSIESFQNNRAILHTPE